MKFPLWVPAALLLAAPNAAAQERYGAKGIFPVYEKDGQWLVFDKSQKKDFLLGLHNNFLVVGSQGAEVFDVARASQTHGGACRNGLPLTLRAALLKGPRHSVGRPIIGIHVPESFKLKGSKAVYAALKNQVGENIYQALQESIKQSAIADIKASALSLDERRFVPKFSFKADDAGAAYFSDNPNPEKVYVKIDFASPIRLKGVPGALVLVEETQISASYRRCLRLAAGGKLLGDCVPMPRSLMAETALLQFVSYDPSGGGTPYLLAFTRSQPLWGDERWGFVLRQNGPTLFLMDTMDIRCRESF